MLEMQSLALAEAEELAPKVEEAVQEIVDTLLPPEKFDQNDASFEVILYFNCKYELILTTFHDRFVPEPVVLKPDYLRKRSLTCMSNTCNNIWDLMFMLRSMRH